ncbi:ZIP family metal transporter [Clostridium formicaceticum]|uniref:ZIP family metal transporter n=1 Tax=Clostridium formicaceticum TaxID=1497 RepID=A0AAC9WEY7_9CLOT|nr:ZIP family metal transporter [Clostridium formicaceticum]AOY75893.1 ZIP family metal transporter [Clostridium formicaceticum]ARE86236.1 Zinc transporter ZupT [Clostridium formicaceticum]
MVDYLSQYNIIYIGLIASLAAGLCTGVGALPIFFTKNVSHRTLDTMLGFAAGVMLAATSFSLIVPAIEYAGEGIHGAGIAVVGILAGGIFLDLMDHFAPHSHVLKLGKKGEKNNLTRVWLFVIAITLHNFPEGLAVGVGFGNGNVGNGLAIAIAIGLQNIPEGLAVALALIREKYSTTKAFFIALATGLVEPIGGVIGVGLVHIIQPILPYALTFAAGAMLYVICDEIIPETQKHGYERYATYGLLIGFVLMMFLDIALG